jgi:2-polyprenyl-3-methyl-5-hydroxy-6-metoxy-1,4-benzoquinol methylase
MPVQSTGLADLPDYRRLLRRIIGAYDSTVVRAYSMVRFRIINLKILHVLSLCMRGKRRVLEIGCGYGLFGCYFASRDPSLTWYGLDLDEGRIAMAQRAAHQLGLSNARFGVADAREALEVEEQFDAVVMMDLVHHLPDESKRQLITTVLSRLAPGGVLVIKDVTRRPRWKLFFTWALDVLVTRGFEMWYWTPAQFREAIDERYAMEAYPMSEWLPYPHIVYLVSERPARAPAFSDERGENTTSRRAIQHEHPGRGNADTGDSVATHLHGRSNAVRHAARFQSD